VFELLRPEQEKQDEKFLMEWFCFALMLSTSDGMIGDPFLVNVFRRLLTRTKDTAQIVYALDLLLGCGEEDYDKVLRS